MMKLETPIGEFTTDSYKIPAEDTLAVSPAIISFSSDDYKIISIAFFAITVPRYAAASTLLVFSSSAFTSF